MDTSEYWQKCCNSWLVIVVRGRLWHTTLLMQEFIGYVIAHGVDVKAEMVSFIYRLYKEKAKEWHFKNLQGTVKWAGPHKQKHGWANESKYPRSSNSCNLKLADVTNNVSIQNFLKFAPNPEVIFSARSLRSPTRSPKPDEVPETRVGHC